MVQSCSSVCRTQGREPALRDRDGAGYELHFARLEPDIVGRLTTHDTVVGRSPYLHRLRLVLVDHPPDLIL